MISESEQSQPVAEWNQPASCTDVLRFVGLANCFRKFARNLPQGLAERGPLAIDSEFSWARHQSFDAIMKALHRLQQQRHVTVTSDGSYVV